MSGCIVCLEDKWDLECVHCKKHACSECQVRFDSSPECMGCRARFSKKTLFEKLGSEYCKSDKFMREYAVKYLSMYSKFDTLAELEKDNLIKKLFDLYRKGSLTEDEDTNLSYRNHLELAEKDEVSVRCPDCDVLCVAENHTCNEVDKTSFSLIQKETKPCPKCGTRIYKTDGCLHMQCTNCNGKFDWNTGEPCKFGYSIYKPKDVFGLNKKRVGMGSVTRLLEGVSTPPTMVSISDAAKAFYVLHVMKTIQKGQKTLEDILKKNVDNESLMVKKAFSFIEKYEYMEVVGSLLADCINRADFRKIDDELFDISREYMMPLVYREICLDKQQFLIRKNGNTKSVLVQIEPSSKEPIISMLNTKQKEHGDRVFGSLRDINMAFDCSHPGAGKTYVALRAAEKLNIKRMVVLCPKILVDKWSSVIRERNCSFHCTIISYSVLAGTVNYQPKHGFLHRVDMVTDKCKKKVKFYPTMECDSDTMLVVDESHRNLSHSSLSVSYTHLTLPTTPYV